MAESNVGSVEGCSKFNLNWSPEAPAGLKFTNVLPDNFGAGYEALPSESDQTELKTKMKSSRLMSRRHSKVFFTYCTINPESLFFTFYLFLQVCSVFHVYIFSINPFICCEGQVLGLKESGFNEGVATQAKNRGAQAEQAHLMHEA
jgi:hypothetical protein